MGRWCKYTLECFRFQVNFLYSLRECQKVMFYFPLHSLKSLDVWFKIDSCKVSTPFLLLLLESTDFYITNYQERQNRLLFMHPVFLCSLTYILVEMKTLCSTLFLPTVDTSPSSSTPGSGPSSPLSGNAPCPDGSNGLAAAAAAVPGEVSSVHSSLDIFCIVNMMNLDKWDCVSMVFASCVQSSVSSYDIVHKSEPW